MLNFELRRLMECTREDKLACLPLIDKIVGLANTARSQGLLALEDIIPDLGDYLLKTGISMLVDGRDQDTTYEIMTTHIIASYKTGVDLLRQMIICDGVLAIQAGISPRLISEKLVSYLGEDIILELIEQADEDGQDSGNNNGRKTDEDESAVINEDSSDDKNKALPVASAAREETSAGAPPANSLAGLIAEFSSVMKRIEKAKAAVELEEIEDSVLAGLLVHLDAEISAELLASLAQDRQVQIIKMMATAQQNDATLDSLYKIKESLDQNLTMGRGNPGGSGGDNARKAAVILNYCDRSTERFIVSAIEDEDAELSEKILSKMFIFSDITILNARDTQTLLHSADYQTIAVALKGADEDVKRHVFANLSKRASQGIKEDMEYIGAVRLSDVEEAQQTIINIVRELDESGEIIVSRREE